MKYIDADKLIFEIESIVLVPQIGADYNDGRNDIKMMVLDIIDSLQQEQPEVDLEKELDAYFGDGQWKSGFCVGKTGFLKIASHFYNLGLNARK